MPTSPPVVVAFGDVQQVVLVNHQSTILSVCLRAGGLISYHRDGDNPEIFTNVPFGGSKDKLAAVVKGDLLHLMWGSGANVYHARWHLTLEEVDKTPVAEFPGSRPAAQLGQGGNKLLIHFISGAGDHESRVSLDDGDNWEPAAQVQENVNNNAIEDVDVNISQLSDSEASWANTRFGGAPGTVLRLVDAATITGVSDGASLNTWDNIGTEGGSLSQVSAGPPTYFDSGGPAGGPRVYFIGGQAMEAALGGLLAQPCVTWCVYRFDNPVGGSRDHLMGGTASNECFFQRDGNRLWWGAGATITRYYDVMPQAGDWGWTVAYWDGASSIIDSNVVGANPAGGSPGANGITGLRLGRSVSLTYFHDGDIAEAGVSTGTTAAAVAAYLEAKYPGLPDVSYASAP